jgi:outer membrane protein assembly factor BamB
MYDADIMWTSDIPTLAASPVVADIDPDIEFEVVIGGTDGKVYALRGLDGTVKWSTSVAAPIHGSAAAIGDINNDTHFEIVIGDQNGTVYALNGDGGSIKWTRSVGSQMSSSPALGEVDGDSATVEIVVSLKTETICLNGADGSILWTAATGSSGGMNVYSSPALGDIDNDGTVEVVVAGNNLLFHALNGADGTVKWTATITASPVGGNPPPLIVCPAIGDLDGDNMPEVVVHDFSGRVYAFDGLDGSIKWGIMTGTTMGTSANACVTLADIDADGRREVLLRAGGIRALDEYTGAQLWSYQHPSDSKTVPTPVCADLDSDGKLEVVGGNHGGYAFLLEGEDGSLKWDVGIVSGDIHPTHAIADIDGDGCLEIVGASCSGPVYAFDSDCSVGIEEDEAEPGSVNLKVLPAGNRLAVLFSLPVPSEVSVSIIDVCGRTRSHIDMGRLHSGSHRVGFDMTAFENGIYFVQLCTGDKSSTQKATIIR